VDVLRESIEADLRKFEVPGASWAVVDGGQITEIGTAGVLRAGESAPVTPDTLFQACSISKPVAVLAMLRLVDRGLLDLDDDVNRRLTSWQVPPTSSWQPVVTLRQLASHSAGLTVHGFPGYHHEATLPTVRQILDGVAPANTFGVRVDTIPGTQFRYSGGGTIVMQQLLEDVTSTPFRDLMRELVLEPLEMSDSDYAQPLPRDRHAIAAVAHDRIGEPIAGRWHAYPELAAAGLWTTPTDLAKFAIAIQRAYAGGDGALLSPDLAREMLTPQIATTDRIGGLDHLGLGLFLADEGRRFGHSGGNEGFKCHLLAYRDVGQGAVVMTNSDNGAWLTQRAFAAIASAQDWPSYPQQLDERVVPLDEELDRIAGRYRVGDHATVELVRAGGGFDATFQGQQQPVRFIPVNAHTFVGLSAETALIMRDGQLIFAQNDAEISSTRLG
jgi:CubicO group peptidase (beta-lactamase class C family)